MASFKLLSKIFPASPDKYLQKAPDSQAALARMAHLNGIINEINDCKFYEHDVDAFGSTISVDSSKGIIELVNFGLIAPAAGNFVDSTVIVIANPALMNNVVDVDQVYIQVSVYYNNQGQASDTAVPYVIATGAVPLGREFKVYNAGASAPGNKNWTGLFYIYYEIKVIN